MEPGAFRELHNRLQSEMQGKGRVEVLAMTVVAEGLQSDEFSHPPPQQRQQRAAVMAATALVAAQEPSSSSSLGGFITDAVRPTGMLPLPGSGSGAVPSVQGDAPPVQGDAPSVQGDAAPQPAAGTTGRGGAAGEGGGGGGAETVLYRGSIEELPEAHASRKERFAELDTLQPGWEVELRSAKGGGAAVEAVFFSPAGEQVGAFAAARRAALAAHKALPGGA